MVATSVTCRWDWCTRNFPDSSSLKVHVEEDHIAAAVPVKRKDIPLLRRAEDGESVQETSSSRWWESGTQSSVFPPSRVERAVMTDPLLATSPRPDQLILSGTFGQSPSISGGMHGTPSPPPPITLSPPVKSTMVDAIGPSTLPRVSPMVSHVSTPSPHTENLNRDTKPTLSSGMLQDYGPSPYMVITSPVNDAADRGGKNAGGEVDPDVSVEIVESSLISSLDSTNAEIAAKGTEGQLNSMWQLQSQLPLPESLGNGTSFSIPTINPIQLHAPLPIVEDSRPAADRQASESRSPSRSIHSQNSQGYGTSRLSNLAPRSNLGTSVHANDSILSHETGRDTHESSSHPHHMAAFASTSSSHSDYNIQESLSLGDDLSLNVNLEYRYTNNNVESQQIQTQAPFHDNSFGSSSYSND